MLSRRRLLATAAATGSANALPKWTFPAYAEAAPNSEAAKLNGLMETFFQENLQQNPESATLLGLDKGSNANLKSRLRDESAAGIAAAKALNAGQLARLKQVDAAKLTSMDRVNYDTLLYVGESRAQLAPFDYGGFGYGPSPFYVRSLPLCREPAHGCLSDHSRLPRHQAQDRNGCGCRCLSVPAGSLCARTRRS